MASCKIRWEKLPGVSSTPKLAWTERHIYYGSGRKATQDISYWIKKFGQPSLPGYTLEFEKYPHPIGKPKEVIGWVYDNPNAAKQAAKRHCDAL